MAKRQLQEAQWRSVKPCLKRSEEPWPMAKEAGTMQVEVTRELAREWNSQLVGIDTAKSNEQDDACQAAQARNASYDDFIMEGALAKPVRSRKLAFRDVIATVANSLCLRCQTLKLQCSGGRPCKNCVEHGMEDRCVQLDAVRLNLEPEKPLPFRNNTYSWSTTSCNTAGPPMPPNVEVMTNLLGKALGMPLPWINNIIINLPPKLYQTIFETIGPLVASMDVGLDQLRKMQRISTNTDLDAFPHCGYWSLHYDVGVMHANINRVFAQMIDRHPEEVVDRMARNTLPPVSSEFDFLCVALDDLPFIICGQPNSTQHKQRYLVVARRLQRSGQHDPFLLRITSKARYNEQGRVVQLEKWFQPVTPAEFDRTMEVTPELVRPLQAAIGDRRTGKELLQQHERNFQEDRIGVMAYRKDGDAKLDRLADAIKQRYRPLLEVAIKKRLAGAGDAAPADASRSLNNAEGASCTRLGS